MTPQRKNFSYPRSLTHTRPHLELIGEFEITTTNEPEILVSEIIKLLF